MKKLFKNKKGFTLMEMLIVVAIIVILVAVSMPVFTSQLEKAKTATDDANIRAAKAVAVAEYLAPDSDIITSKTYYYDAAKGSLQPDNNTGITGYGKATAVKDEVIVVTYSSEGVVTAKFPSGS